jgi:hypothetical protein
MGLFFGSTRRHHRRLSRPKKASKKAYAAQKKGFENPLTNSGCGSDRRKPIYNPYITAGQQGLGGYGNLVGIGGPEAQQAAIQQLQQSPYYQSLYRRGEEALLQNASATGGIRGGNTARSLADFGADTLSTTIDRAIAAIGRPCRYRAASDRAVGPVSQRLGRQSFATIHRQSRRPCRGLFAARADYGGGNGRPAATCSTKRRRRLVAALARPAALAR